LDGTAGKSGDAHPHQTVTERRQDRLGERGDARRTARLDDKPRLVGEIRKFGTGRSLIHILCGTLLPPLLVVLSMFRTGNESSESGSRLPWTLR